MAEIAQRERVDHLYVALPLEEHARLLNLMEITSREFLDVKVVPADEDRFGSEHGYNTSPSGGAPGAIASATDKINPNGLVAGYSRTIGTCGRIISRHDFSYLRL